MILCARLILLLLVAVSYKAAAFPVTIKTAHGTAVIKSQPKRVVTLGVASEDWCLLLGVNPIAIERNQWGGDAQGYTPWYKAAVLQAGLPLPVVVQSTPNLQLDTIMRLQPDLILAPYSGLQKGAFLQLNQFVPVIGYPDKPWMLDADAQLTLIARALGKTKEAKQVRLLKNKIFKGITADRPWLRDMQFAYVHVAAKASNLNVYTAGDTRASMLFDLGLKPVPAITKLYNYANSFYVNIGFESINLLDEADLIMAWFNSVATKEAVEQMKLFQRLPAVQRGNYLALTDKSLILALSFANPLSLQWALPKFIPLFDQATQIKQ